MERVVASIEARMRSSRLPGKVLLDIQGAPSMSRLLQRLRRARSLNGIILATTLSPLDDPLVAWAQSEGLPYFRGSEEDVLARVVGAHRQMNTDIIVEICGDCPMIEPDVVDLCVDAFRRGDSDVVSTVRQQSFPQGIDAEVFRLSALEEIENSVRDPAVREHVSLYFYEHPERYRIHYMTAPEHWRRPDLRLVLDYPEDLVLIRGVYERLLPAKGPEFGLDDVINLLDVDRSLARVNAHCEERPVR